MTLARCVILILVLIVLGVLAIREQLSLLSLGYKVSESRARRAALEDESRALERRIDAMANPAAAASRLNDAPGRVYGSERTRSGEPVTHRVEAGERSR